MTQGREVHAELSVLKNTKNICFPSFASTARMFGAAFLRQGGVWTDLKFVKKFTRPNFRAKEFYTLKMRKSRLF